MARAFIKVWVRRGGMLVRTEYLDENDPDHPYNQLLKLGFRPEDYGVRRAGLDAIIAGRSIEELAQEIKDLREELIAWQIHG